MWKESISRGWPLLTTVDQYSGWCSIVSLTNRFRNLKLGHQSCLCQSAMLTVDVIVRCWVSDDAVAVDARRSFIPKVSLMTSFYRNTDVIVALPRLLIIIFCEISPDKMCLIMKCENNTRGVLGELAWCCDRDQSAAMLRIPKTGVNIHVRT